MLEQIKRGFTLIELAITGAILAVLVATVVAVAISQAGSAQTSTQGAINDMSAYENTSVTAYTPTPLS
jgi:prepilin-type N-terminal cleavage/methylation domain-containing protein